MANVRSGDFTCDRNMLWSAAMTNDVGLEYNFTDFKRDAVIVSFVVIALGIFGFYDVYEDWVEHVSSSHLISESLFNLLKIAAGFYLLSRICRSKRPSVNEVQKEYLNTRQSLTEYKSQVEKLREGITRTITDQFKVWKLTNAEEDICLLLLKGFSLQEIAKVRATSERTIRQQASTMYKKTGLSGRAQLSAFFLEDILVVNARAA